MDINPGPRGSPTASCRRVGVLAGVALLVGLAALPLAHQQAQHLDAFDTISGLLSPLARSMGIATRGGVHNNLGGAGPMTGEQHMYLPSVGTTDQGTPFDLKIEVIGSQSDAYIPGNVAYNTINGAFAQINLAPDKSVELQLGFFYPGGEYHAALHEVVITVYDLDMEYDVNLDGVESIVAHHFDHYLLDTDTLVEIEPIGGGAIFTATQKGGAYDNPTSHPTPGSGPPTPTQLARAVTLVYLDTWSVVLHFATSKSYHGGRNIVLAVGTPFTDYRDECVDPSSKHVLEATKGRTFYASVASQRIDALAPLSEHCFRVEIGQTIEGIVSNDGSCDDATFSSNAADIYGSIAPDQPFEGNEQEYSDGSTNGCDYPRHSTLYLDIKSSTQGSLSIDVHETSSCVYFITLSGGIQDFGLKSCTEVEKLG